MNAPIYSVIHGILMWIYEGGLIYFNTFLENFYLRIAGYEINSFNYRIIQGLYKISAFNGFIVQERVTSRKKHFAFIVPQLNVINIASKNDPRFSALLLLDMLSVILLCFVNIVASEIWLL